MDRKKNPALTFSAKISGPGSECGGGVRIIASVEDPAVINKILEYLDESVVYNGITQPRRVP